MQLPRAAHQTTVIASDAILITGGCSGRGCSPVERSAELLDPVALTSVPVKPMNTARVSHIATSLGNGQVLVAGGWTGESTTSSAEVFDRTTLSFSAIPSMTTPRMDAVATALNDGSVLITGGASATNRPLAGAEYFIPRLRRFEVAGSMIEARAHHAAVRLRDGRVLIAGGLRGRNLASNTAEIFDPSTRSFRPTGPMTVARCKHAGVLLADGRVMMIAGSSDCDDRHRIAQTEIFDPESGQFTPGPTLINPRYKIVGAATVLQTGEVVVAGDASDVEVWTPGTPGFVRVSGSLREALAFSTVTVLPSGGVLVAGGYDNKISPTANAWLINHP